jgi:hypothetical protein
MRRRLALTATAAATLGGCGGDNGSPSVTFPPLDTKRSAETGHPSFPVSSEQEGTELCDAAQGSPPEVAQGARQIEFNVAGTGSDVTCMLP